MADVKALSPFRIGLYRPIYLWGGAGTVRMNRLKFMDVPVDELAHHEVHTPTGADRVVNEIYCNWVHLMYDWGFPPEIEQADWAVFEQAALAYHRAGAKVFAYIQTSNCVYDGSFLYKDWYATDPQGKRITYFTYAGRYMACLNNPDWQQRLKDLIRGAIERGADGIFFDNLFQGGQPISMFGTWLGTTGCHCRHCQQQYLEETDQSIPTAVRPQDPDYTRYLLWRAGQVTRLMTEMAAYARGLQPGIPISANDFDPVLRNSFLVYGIDLEALTDVQDIIMIENFGLPRWDDRPKPRLANNALTLRTARSIVGTAAHLSVLSYDVGIGFDPVYPARRYRQGIAEAAACGVSMTTKGTEYHDGEKMTVLTASEYAPIRTAIGQYHTWLETHSPLFASRRRNIAPIGLLYPGNALWLDWHRVAPLFFGAGQALTIEGLPWTVIHPHDSMQDLEALLVFDEAGLPSVRRTPGVQVVVVPDLEFWRPRSPSLIGQSALLRGVVTFVVKAALRAYGGRKLARWAMDAAGLPKIVTQSPHYGVPARGARKALLETLPANIYPRLKARQPALIEIWQDKNALQIHLVNYAAQPQSVQVQFPSPVAGRVVSPDGEENRTYEGAQFDIPLDVYKILLIDRL